MQDRSIIIDCDEESQLEDSTRAMSSLWKTLPLHERQLLWEMLWGNRLAEIQARYSVPPTISQHWLAC